MGSKRRSVQICDVKESYVSSSPYVGVGSRPGKGGVEEGVREGRRTGQVSSCSSSSSAVGRGAVVRMMREASVMLEDICSCSMTWCLAWRRKRRRKKKEEEDDFVWALPVSGVLLL